jgi:hypothetical protein
MTDHKANPDLPFFQKTDAKHTGDERLEGAVFMGGNTYSITGLITNIVDYPSSSGTQKQVTVSSYGGSLLNFFYCPWDMDEKILKVFEAVLNSGLEVTVAFMSTRSGRPIVSVTVFASQAEAE